MSKHLKANQVWFGCVITEEESNLLKKYCEQTSRTQTEVVREFLRSLQQKVTTPEPPSE